MESVGPARGSFSVATWCQPADVDSEDVIMLDGEVVDPADETVRSMVVSHINAIAKSAVRNITTTGGWKATGPGAVVMEIPVDSGLPNVFSNVMVLVRTPDPARLRQAADQVAKTADLAGYSSDADSLRPLLDYQAPRPKGLVARIWDWIRALFGKGPAS